MAFDPNLPDETKKGLKTNRAIPFQFGGAMMTDNAFARNPVGTARMVNGEAPTVADVSPAPEIVEGAPPPATTAAKVRPSIVFNPTEAQKAPSRPAGLRALPQGVVRSAIPGVYLARGKDGSFMASNVVGANGTPDFGGGAAANAAAVGVKSLRRPGGTSFDPRFAVTDSQGFTMSPGTQGGEYNPNAGAVDPNGAASLPGASRAPDAGFTYAENSLHMNPSDMIKAAGVNPEAAQQAKEQLIAAMNNDPDSVNPEVAASNRAALAQLEGNVHDVRKQYWGSDGGMYGAMGAGAAGGKGNLGLRDILTNRYRQARLGRQERHDQAMEGIAAANSDRAAAAEDRQARDSMLRNFQTALKTDPAAAATIVQQNAPPPNMSRADFNKWMASDKGMAWQQMLQSVLDQGAMNSMWSGPFDLHDKSALRAGEVGLHRIAFDRNGKFAGMNDAGGGVAYPVDPWFGASNYNMGVVNSVSPQYLKWLQESASQRLAVPSN